MFVIEVVAETCDGETCSECVDGCPVEMLGLVEYADKQISSVITDMSECIGCMACESVCPTESISVVEY